MKKYIILLISIIFTKQLHTAQRQNQPPTILSKKNLQNFQTNVSDSEPITPSSDNSFSSSKRTELPTRSKILTKTINDLNDRIEQLEEALNEKQKAFSHVKKKLNQKNKDLAKAQKNHAEELQEIDEDLKNFNSANQFNKFICFMAGGFLGALTSATTILYIWQPNKAHS